jgi:hypothetical protein
VMLSSFAAAVYDPNRAQASKLRNQFSGGNPWLYCVMS